MSWKIDRDYLGSGTGDVPSRVGVGFDRKVFESPRVVRYRFRLLDDDGIVYYGGYYDANAAEFDDAPGGLVGLWKWGENDAGTTALEVKVRDAVEFGLTSREYVGERGLRRGDWVSIYG